MRQITDAWANGTPPGELPHLAEDIEFVNPQGALEGGVRQGRGGFAAAIGALASSFVEAQFVTYALVANGGRVAVLGHTHARGSSTRVPVEREHGFVWTIEDGWAVRFEWRHDVPGTLAAAGAAPETPRVEYVRSIPLVVPASA